GFFIAMPDCVEYQGALATMSSFAEKTCAEIKAQLHRHIEAGQAAGYDLHAREIVDAQITFTDHGRDLGDPNLSAVGSVERTAWVIATRNDREDHCTKHRLEPVIEWAIDEDGFRQCQLTLRHATARTCTIRRG